MEQTGEWIGDGAVVMDEKMIEVSESKKVLKFFDGWGNGPVVNSFYLPLVHGYPIFIDNVTKEPNFRLMELILLILEEEIEL